MKKQHFCINPKFDLHYQNKFTFLHHSYGKLGGFVGS